MDKTKLKIWVSSLLQNDDLFVGKIEPNFFEQFEKYIDNQPRFHAEIIEHIYNFYLSVFEKYRIAFSEWGDNPDENAPIISKSDELSYLLKYQRLFIPNTERTGAFGLAFWCKWEIEHGLGLRYENWTFREIGDNDTHWNF